MNIAKALRRDGQRFNIVEELFSTIIKREVKQSLDSVEGSGLNVDVKKDLTKLHKEERGIAEQFSLISKFHNGRKKR